MAPELDEVLCKLEQATAHFTPDDWLRSAPGKWNSTLIVEHLLLSYVSTTFGLLKIMHVKEPVTGTETLRTRIATFVVTRLNYFPHGRTAPQQAIPKGRLQPGSLKEVRDALQAMDRKLTQAEELFGAGKKILDHPALGPLTAQQWRRFHRTHGLHHIRQIELGAKEHRRLT